MSCPFKEHKEQPSIPAKGLLYAEYLMLDRVLSSQRLLSADEDGKNPACDEHLFIIIHQTYELWFKEILFELNIARDAFAKEHLNLSEIIRRLNRIVMILKVLVEQVLILETMTPMDFNDFRSHLDTASGFQSLQFRLIENTLGVRDENRNLKFNQNYGKVFTNDENALEDLKKTLTTSSLLQLIEKWLENTPHLDVLWKHYKHVVESEILSDNNKKEIIECKDENNDNALKKIREQFDTIFNNRTHEALLKRGERKISLNALHAAIIITLYKDDAMFSASHQILTLLVDVDAMLCRWRFNHMLLVQRMIGSMQIGTGGSSGYQYLRSTLSDRYKPFVDLSNLTTFLISKSQVLPLHELVMNSPNQHVCLCIKKGKKSSRRQNGCGKRAFYGRPGYKDGGKQRCLHCANTGGSFAKNCNVCIEAGGHTPHNRIRSDFQDLTVNSASEDEKKELESSYESTSSISSASIH